MPRRFCARDADGRLGVKDAPAALLATARKRTRGFPRALEALVAILAADRNTTLPELLADAKRMPENVVEELVGEAFSRLDAQAQQVMQALAIYALPVAPVAVDYLLAPFEPAIDSAPVLSRLVNMSFVRRDAGHYYLHQVDRDYALHRVALGEPSNRGAEPLSFTQHALRKRGADYFQQIRTPRETWRTLTDLAPQLAEFELRYQAGDYDTAAQVLIEIDFEYLIRWGHVHLALEMHDRLQGHLTDLWTDGASKGNLGICYSALGETRRAIEFMSGRWRSTRRSATGRAKAPACAVLRAAFSSPACKCTLAKLRRPSLHAWAKPISSEIWIACSQYPAACSHAAKSA